MMDKPCKRELEPESASFCLRERECYGVGRVGAFGLETSGRSLECVRRAEAQERGGEAA